MFVKELAKKLSKKRMLQCTGSERRSVSCVREQPFRVSEAQGYRQPWYKENTKAVSKDFRLTVHEADLDLRMEDVVKRDEE